VRGVILVLLTGVTSKGVISSAPVVAGPACFFTFGVLCTVDL